MRWFSTPPAAARVVPRPEKKIEGVGVIEESLEGHSELSFEIMACSFASVVGGSRRPRAWTLDMEGRVRRVLRMCEPWSKLSVLCPLI